MIFTWRFFRESRYQNDHNLQPLQSTINIINNFGSKFREQKLQLRQSIFEFFRCQINHYQNSISKWSSHRFPFLVENSHIFDEILIFSKTRKNSKFAQIPLFLLELILKVTIPIFGIFFGKISFLKILELILKVTIPIFENFFGKIRFFENFENFGTYFEINSFWMTIWQRWIVYWINILTRYYL